jgi:hypothetical protein
MLLPTNLDRAKKRTALSDSQANVRITGVYASHLVQNIVTVRTLFHGVIICQGSKIVKPVAKKQHYLKTIMASKTLLKKKPIELLKIYNLSLFDIARIRNRNNPVQTKRIISIGGRLVA